MVILIEQNTKNVVLSCRKLLKIQLGIKDAKMRGAYTKYRKAEYLL